MRRSLTAAALTLTALAASCNLYGGGTEGSGCVSTSEYYEETVWPQVMGSICIDCHSPGGSAEAERAKFQLLPPGYPGFLDRNLEHTNQFALTEFEGISVLLQKPLGELNHGGGKVLKEDSPEYEALRTLVEMLKEGNTCDADESVEAYEEVTELGASPTFRKAALHLGYRLPTSDESARLVEEGEDALPALIDGLMNEDAFYERLKDIVNDNFLTDRYLAYTGYAVNQLDESMYPQSGEPWDALTDDELKRKINRAIAREPLEMVALIAKEGRPLTEIVTGDYMVVNPFSAAYLNADVGFDDPTNENEWRTAKRRGVINGAMTDIPGGGVMTSPMWLNRFPTTPTNRNRHRARMVMNFFLATDILKVGDRPLDPANSSLYANPTRDDPSCATCHEIMDPIAGGFLKFDDNDQEEYRPDRSWYNDMKAPGFGTESMTLKDFPTAPTWLGQRLAGDQRFGYAMVKMFFEGIIGRSPRAYPEDLAAADYPHQFSAWQAQEESLQAMARAFEADNYNLKGLVRAIILSPYYRAENAPAELEDARKATLEEVGTGRLSTPMLLSRKIEAVTGKKWARGWDQNDYLMTDYRILYGGIDSDTITKRLTIPNGVMASVAWRMANEVSCGSVASDFSRDKDSRKLLRDVDMTDVPETEAGDAVSAAQTRIKDNIRYLHTYVLGEDATDEEVERTYSLFYATWKEGQGLMADEESGIGDWLPWQCQHRVDLVTGEDLPDDQRIRQDPDYTIRAWMAVVTYLMSDYRFLYE